ncbi:MAG: hypothetical protein H0Z33_11885 [Bacillaceae bacterium]|nr:hypothetical protein [Bacillaceae bacterium]
MNQQKQTRKEAEPQTAPPQRTRNQTKQTETAKTPAHSDDLRYPNADEIYE